jgi:Protein of unknown function (DUF1360)
VLQPETPSLWQRRGGYAATVTTHDARRNAATESPVPGLPGPENLDGLEEPPTKPVDYGMLNAAYGALLAGVIASQLRRGDDEEIGSAELVRIGAASFALSKAVAREKIGTWAREPFVEERNGERQPRGRRLRRAVGELVTCTRCVGAWSSLGLVGLRLTNPTAGRIVNTVLATSALNDFLQTGFKALCETTNTLEATSEAQASTP